MALEAITGNQRDRSRRELLRRLAELVPDIGEEVTSAFGGPLLKTSDVALLFGVSERCIRKWSDAGKLSYVRTPGKHRLFPAKGVAEALKAAANGGVGAGTILDDENE